jgi:hypothetical protein
MRSAIAAASPPSPEASRTITHRDWTSEGGGGCLCTPRCRYVQALAPCRQPLQIWGGVKDDWPDVEKFAYRAYVWVKRECPSELKSNELLRYWFENWDINPDS